MGNVWRWLIVSLILLVRESFCTTELNVDHSLSDLPPLSIPHYGQYSVQKVYFACRANNSKKEQQLGTREQLEKQIEMQ
jgi:hypothetical protein